MVTGECGLELVKAVAFFPVPRSHETIFLLSGVDIFDQRKCAEVDEL